MPPWANNQTPSPANLSEITQRAIDMALLSLQNDGEIGGIGWWQTANAFTAIALHDIWSSTKHNYARVAEAMRKCEARRPGLINEFNDDTLWFAVCCCHMYRLGGDSWFLDTARGVWQHVYRTKSVCGKGQMRFQDHDMEGGCYWTTRPDEGQINSISSGLYAELSLRLADVLGGGSREQYVDAAHCSLSWILRCRYRPDEAVVLDGFLTKDGTSNDWTFTYTTGVVLGVCSLLYKESCDEGYLKLACHIAHRAMRNPTWVDKNGVLTERSAFGPGTHNPAENNDSVGFKSVLMRNLAILYTLIDQTRSGDPMAERTKDLIKTFVNINLNSQLERNTNGNGQYGPWWNGPFEMPTSHSQIAVLDVMAAAHAVN
ncbi:glycoside hydrolase family 76 protein [Piedraia hortae CBS 480.64]|uniref:Glycoside hydrolase family 76 protein n=1 Tax=Piedraia hortae CBS 480.64 TaxID=1314780 RepID=A0A6A7C6V6_9PEZI|nr:glycoside hydrolase family 76 protein [Piedraia hortae CBS 480.64]